VVAISQAINQPCRHMLTPTEDDAVDRLEDHLCRIVQSKRQPASGEWLLVPSYRCDADDTERPSTVIQSEVTRAFT